MNRIGPTAHAPRPRNQTLRTPGNGLPLCPRARSAGIFRLKDSHLVLMAARPTRQAPDYANTKRRPPVFPREKAHSTREIRFWVFTAMKSMRSCWNGVGNRTGTRTLQGVGGFANSFDCQDGARSRGRTGTPLREPDFESGASANSAIRANLLIEGIKLLRFPRQSQPKHGKGFSKVSPAVRGRFPPLTETACIKNAVPCGRSARPPACGKPLGAGRGTLEAHAASV